MICMRIAATPGASFVRLTKKHGARIHAGRESDLSAADHAEIEPPFDDNLYLWEQDYFLDHFVRGCLNREFPDESSGPAEQTLVEIRRRLTALPRCLIHRDFQSQNILLHEDHAWLVDYQGLRLGLAEYDLASLLYDPYVNLTPVQREELLKFYAGLRGLGLDAFKESFLLCAAQRLMQAIGAYGNLSRNLGKPQFLQHIPVGVERLASVCAESPLLRPLATLLRAAQ